MSELRIERLGGIGGFGLPGSRVKSEGRVDLDALGEEDRKRVEALFAGGARAAPAVPLPDGFRYRIARTTEAGEEEAIELPESDVPQVLAQAVVDRLV